MAKILLVEDDKSAAEFVISWLTAERHVIDHAKDGAEGLDYMLMSEYDVILLDWDLPKLSGIDALKRFRSNGRLTPVIMLTAKNQIEDKECGLDGGADDYLSKPFSLVELSARIRVQLRRRSGQPQNQLELRDIVLIPEQMRVIRKGKSVDLLPKEFSLLEFFMRNPDRVFSADAVMQRVWQSDSESTTNAFRSALKRLRQKLEIGEEEEALIETIHGAGYRLNSKSST